MADMRRWQHVFLLLVIIIYCTAKPLLESTDAFSDYEATTISRQEEMTAQTTRGNENLTDEEQTDDTTTLCPEELMKQNHRNSFSEENETILNDSEHKLQGTNEFEDKPNSTEENVDNTTTMCPEETEMQNNKLNYLDSSNAIENKEKDTSLTHGQIELETGLWFAQEGAKNPNIIKNYPKESDNSLNELNVEHTGTSHKALENRFEDELDTNVEDQSTNALHQSVTESSQYATTICPEELLNQQEEQNELKANEKAEVQFESHDSEALAVSKQDLSQKEEERFQNQIDTNKINANDQPSENTDRTTTICPEELAKHQEEAGGNEISVKTLLNVQKDSVLLKLVKKKYEAKNSKSADQVRRKRQTQDYSPYYSNKPSYDSPGVAVSTSDDSAQQPRASSQQNYFQPAATHNNVRTYQQIQRQYQNPYPKAYHNYVKPIKSYHNPSSYARYPSNGNFSNLYKLKNGGNRRQYQTNVRSQPTTVRSTRATSKKKFRPSPVFA